MLTIWHDSVLVQALSNCFPNENIIYKLAKKENGFKESPLVFKEYNRKSTAIDKNNQLISYIKFPYKTNLWWIKMYWYILTVTLTNCYLIYRYHTMRKLKKWRGKDMLSRREYILCIVRELLNADGGVKKLSKKVVDMILEPGESNDTNESQIQNTKILHFPRKATKYKKCKYNNCSKFTTFKCHDCGKYVTNKVYLCYPECFEKYHKNNFIKNC